MSESTWGFPRAGKRGPVLCECGRNLLVPTQNRLEPGLPGFRQDPECPFCDNRLKRRVVQPKHAQQVASWPQVTPGTKVSHLLPSPDTEPKDQGPGCSRSWPSGTSQRRRGRCPGRSGAEAPCRVLPSRIKPAPPVPLTTSLFPLKLVLNPGSWTTGASCLLGGRLCNKKAFSFLKSQYPSRGFHVPGQRALAHNTSMASD